MQIEITILIRCCPEIDSFSPNMHGNSCQHLVQMINYMHRLPVMRKRGLCWLFHTQRGYRRRGSLFRQNRGYRRWHWLILCLQNQLVFRMIQHVKPFQETLFPFFPHVISLERSPDRQRKITFSIPVSHRFPSTFSLLEMQ